MNQVLWAGAGGFLGASLRYGATLLAARFLSAAHQPWMTLVVNMVGCLGLGLFLAYAHTRSVDTASSWHVFIAVGVLGGFTTYSTFGVGAVEMWSDASPLTSLLYVGLHLALGLGAAAVGLSLGRALA